MAGRETRAREHAAAVERGEAKLEQPKVLKNRRAPSKRRRKDK